MRESEIQKYWHENFELIGGVCRKVKAEVVNGLPDYLNAYDRRMFLIEFKATGEEPKPHQKTEINAWRDQGVPVFVIDSIEKCQKLLSMLLQRRAFPRQAFEPLR